MLAATETGAMEFDLPAASRLAVAWQPKATRRALAAMLALDARLESAVAHAREPLLAQIRLAWWRDRLRERPDDRPRGEPLLAELGACWRDHEAALVPLVDGWEALLGPSPLPVGAIEDFCAGRGHALAALAEMAGVDGASAEAAGRRWALATFAAGRLDADRDRAIGLARSLPPATNMPHAVRGVAVLDALAGRALDRGESLLASRGATLLALRVGMFGR